MVKKNKSCAVTTSNEVHCACLIHGSEYDWKYVDILYNMLSRHLSPTVKLHVYTETSRPVPPPYIKHCLKDWGISGPKKSWWYKMQLFNSDNYQGPLLYFDLDVVITNNIDWIWQNQTNKLWTIKDFKRLYKPLFTGINSSVMWWDTAKYHWIWKQFEAQPLSNILKKYHGDQDFLTEVLTVQDLRFFDENSMKSWRWQCLDGGYDFKTRRWYNPNTGTKVGNDTSVLIFHGRPKPDQVADSFIKQHWQ